MDFVVVAVAETREDFAAGVVAVPINSTVGY